MKFRHLPHFALCAAIVPAAALLAVPARAAPGSLQDFTLPPGNASPTPQPQGPVVPDVPESQVPARPTPTPAPSPTATAARPPVPIELPRAQPRPQPRATPSATPQRNAAPESAAAPGPLPVESATPPAETLPEPASPPISTPAAPLPAPAVSAPAEDDGNLPLYMALAALVAAIGAFAVWRWRGGAASPARHAVPVVERPRLDRTAAPAPTGAADVPAPAPAPVRAPEPVAAPLPPVSAAPPQGPLAIDLTPVRMSMTLVNAALGWRLSVANSGTEPLDGVAVELDMISAHKDLSPADGSAGPAPGAERHEIGRMEPGETRTLQGDIRLPFPSIKPVWQGNVALLLPLVRLRMLAEGAAPVTRAILVGQPSPRNAATLQPFRLDLGPRNYPELASRDLTSRDLAGRDLA